ncbi:MAG: T9SS type A sorting domain-containing protein [candidate division Zixibacteria bacterium]|nr:T9SS type A sorting domain-containing protein [candidate division Zixibacteria bacterium]
MIRQLLLTLTILAFAACLTPAMGQISAADTFKVVDLTAAAGSIAHVQLLVKNASESLMGLAAFFQIDTNVVRYVVDNDGTNAWVRVALAERGLTDTNVFKGMVPLQMFLTDSTHAGLLAAGSNQNVYYPEGRGVLLEFQLQVKAGIPDGDSTLIRIYSPNDEGGFQLCEYTNRYGDTSIYPTIVSGWLRIGTPPVHTNTPPSIKAITTSSYNVQLGSTVSFSVTAEDDDTPQKITLYANYGGELPVGSTFGSSGQVVGNGAATGTFTWANISQVGNFTITFSCKDDSTAWADPERTVTINVGAPAPTEDILYTASSTTYRQISGGIPGLTGVAIPVNLNNLSDAYGVQFDFLYNNNVIIIDSLVPTTRLTDFTIYDNVGGSPGNIRVVAFGLNNQRIGAKTTGTAIFNFWATIRTDAPTGNSPIRFENAWEATNPNPGVASVKLKFDTTGVFVVDQFGDVNGDSRVDVADAVVTVSYIIGSQTFTTRQFNAADVDQSSAVDVIDLVAIINIIFGSAPANMPQWSGKEAIVRLGDDNGIVAGNVIDVNAEFPTDIAGVQVEIGYNPEKVRFLTPQTTDKSALLYLTYRDDGQGKLVVLLYPRSTSNSRISAGSGTMIKLPLVATSELSYDGKDVHINTAVLSDPNAIGIPVKGLKPILPTDFALNQNYPNPFNPETTIEFAVGSGSANKQVRLVIYNLLGEKIATIINEPLAAGKYTYKWRGTNQDGETVASGVYFYRLTVGDQSQTKKMVLLK